MFVSAKLSTESLHRAQHAFSKLLIRSPKMQGSNSGFPGTAVGQSQNSVRSHHGLPSNNLQLSRSRTHQAEQQSAGFPLPPATSCRSYHANFPSLTHSGSSINQRATSTEGHSSYRSNSSHEHSQLKRSMCSSSVDPKKLRSLENKVVTTDSQWTSSSLSQLQRRADDVKTTSPVYEGDKIITAMPPRPDMSKFKRQWKTTAVGRQQRSRRQSDCEVTVLCYNVLAQCLIESNMYLYDNCHDDILKWDFRKNNLLKEIQDANADILCLQEIQSCHFFDFFSPELEKLGYIGHYQKRTGDKQDGCAIFYKTDKLIWDKSKRVRFYKSDIKVLDRDNVAIIALLRPKAWPEDGPKLCVATTHLLYNPKRGDIKLAQLGVLLAEIDSMAAVNCPPSHSQSPFYHPVILCGDFNSTPHYPLYNFIKNRRLDYVGLPRVTVSGQASSWRSGDSLDWPLWPYDVGVTDTCQFRSVVRERLNDRNNTQKHRGGVGEFFETANSSVEQESWERRFSESIHHSFHLDSVHSHDGDVIEVTTNHAKTNCTVDYIFYSSCQPNNEGASMGLPPMNMMGELKLLGYRSLLTDEEATEMGGLPNHKLSSDHFTLVAKFLLTASK